MAKGGITRVTKGVIYVDRDGKRHVLNREEFHALMCSLARKAKAQHEMKVIENMEVEG